MNSVQTVIRDRDERLGDVGAGSFLDGSRGGSEAVGEGVKTICFRYDSGLYEVSVSATATTAGSDYRKKKT